MIRIALIDDKASVRNMVKQKLSVGGRFEVILSSPDGESFLREMKMMPEDKRPQIALVDLEMPDMDGVATIAAASSFYPGIRYVVLTAFDDDKKILNAIRAGACGYILKEESVAGLQDMLSSMFETGVGPVSPSVAYKILQLVQKEDSPRSTPGSDELFRLSKRETEVLKLLSDGKDYRQIGVLLDISHETVKKHQGRIYQKLQVNNKAEALKIAYSKGLI